MTPRHLTLLLFLLAVPSLDTAAAQGIGRGQAFGGPASALDGASATRRAGPIILSGDVRTSSGEEPHEPVAVKLSCGMNSLTKTYTGKKGQFSFELDNARYAVMDASVTSAGRMASIFSNQPSWSGESSDLSRCRLVAESPGFQSSHIQLGRRSSFDRPGVGTLVLTPIVGSQAALVSVTTLAAPKAARSAFNSAAKELGKGRSAKLPKVIARLEKALSEYPAYAAAWTILAETKQRMGDAEGAAAAFGRAVQADPGYLRPYEPLIEIRMRRQEWEEALALTSAALNLNPANVRLHWLRAVGQFELGNEREALDALDRVESYQAGAERFPQTHHIRGLIYAQRGDFTKAAVELRLFLRAAPDAPAAEAVKKRLVQWQELGVA